MLQLEGEQQVEAVAEIDGAAAMPVDGEGEPFAVLATEHTEFDARLSPDDRWISYTSNESGAPQVYVRPFPGPGRRWQVSAEGGAAGRWGGSGGKLYFQSMDGSVHVADVIITGDTFSVGRIEKLFETSVTPDFQVYFDRAGQSGPAFFGALRIRILL